MKSTGIVRKVDNLGRLVVPKELRDTLGIEEKDSIEIFVDGSRIILQKYKPNEEKEDVKKRLEKILNNANSAFEKEDLQRAIKLIG